MKRSSRVFIISGPSGAGKTTIAKRVLQSIEGLSRSISCTTREKRHSEKEGKDYRFMAEEEFKHLIEQKAFLEWAKILGNFYGTLRYDVEKELSLGNDILLCIDVQGAAQVMRAMPDGVISIFILPPGIKELQKRLSKRGDKPQDIENRLKLAREEMKQISSYKYLIQNDVLHKAVNLIKYIIYAERNRI